MAWMSVLYESQRELRERGMKRGESRRRRMMEMKIKFSLFEITPLSPFLSLSISLSLYLDVCNTERWLWIEMRWEDEFRFGGSGSIQEGYLVATGIFFISVILIFSPHLSLLSLLSLSSHFFVSLPQSPLIQSVSLFTACFSFPHFTFLISPFCSSLLFVNSMVTHATN